MSTKSLGTPEMYAETWRGTHPQPLSTCIKTPQPWALDGPQELKCTFFSNRSKGI